MQHINRYQQHQQMQARIQQEPESSLKLVCVIPCMDEPSMLTIITHLQSRDMPRYAVEIIVVVNHAENASEKIVLQNRETVQNLQRLAQNSLSDCHLHVITAFDLPVKKAGVGLARKIGMDEAMLRLAVVGRPEGIIASLDADCHVESDYFTKLLGYFEDYPKQHAALCEYAHPLEDVDDAVHRQAMISYELFLRYIKLGLGFACLPYAFTAIGSCMVVRANAYARHHGMNMRQAGEDFYFMHKLARERRVETLHGIVVYPSSRLSNRTPFGTGQAVAQACAGDGEYQRFADPDVFVQLQAMVASLDVLFRHAQVMSWLEALPPELALFLQDQGFESAVAGMRANASSVEPFRRHYFTWFDGLKAWRFIHRFRQQHAITTRKAANQLHTMVTGNLVDYNEETLLALYRVFSLPPFSLAEGRQSK